MPNKLLEKGFYRKEDPTDHITLNVRISPALDRMLNMCWYNLQRQHPDTRIHKYDMIRIALQEFIERRPELFDPDFNYQSFKYGHSKGIKK